jgi:hypothetical protein
VSPLPPARINKYVKDDQAWKVPFLWNRSGRYPGVPA